MTIINQGTPLGGATYPFLYRLDRPWAIISYDVTTRDVPRTQSPVLRWVHDSHVHDLYVDGLTTLEFLSTTGLHLSMDKGGFVLSKRISRVMRPHFISAFLSADEVTIGYLEQTEIEAKQWDGIGQVSRSFLRRLIDHLPPDLSDFKRRQLIWELQHGGRFEFTLLTAQGQDKGHLLVKDILETDFVLPRDTKPQVRLRDRTVFVGLHPVHSRDDMRLDVQSLIHLYPFFAVGQLMTWLEDEGDWFLNAVETGDIADVMARVDGDTLRTDRWYLQEYYLSGGHPMWFRSVARATINQHLKRLGTTVYQNLRLPIPGGRYYVAVDAVGDKQLARGTALLDPSCATIWVSQTDWVTFIAHVLGGADQDDALWVYVFTDFDEQIKLLCWRSPNQAGEYVVLKPADNCHRPQWQTVNGTICAPSADSRVLPPRIDTISVYYLNLINPETWLPSTGDYDVQAMANTITRAVANKGVLGQYVNVLMLAQAVYGQPPDRLPAPLEAVIDGTVKTGVDLSALRAWCYLTCEQMLADKIPIPDILQDRLSTGASDIPVMTGGTHWLDELLDRIENHITDIRDRRDSLLKRCMPPIDLFAHVLNHADSLLLGAQFNRIYTTAVMKRDCYDDPYRLPREQSSAFLTRWDVRQQGDILRGALAQVYWNGAGRSDSACWQLGVDNQPGIAHRTLSALREIAILDEIDPYSPSQVMVYPSAAPLQTCLQRLMIRGVWFHWWCVYVAAQGEAIPARMGDVATADANRAKAMVEHLSRTHWRGMALTPQAGNDYIRWQTPKGNIFGVTRHDEMIAVFDTVQLQWCLAQDGDLICLV